MSIKIGRPPKPLSERFWEKVNKTSGCWEWIGDLDKDGYGHLWTGKRSPVASRVSYELNVGLIPAGMCVCHSCDNPKCVRPEHLFLGTAKDNNADRNAKGRQAKGESCSLSALTASNVIKIREMHSEGLTNKQIARRLGLNIQNVYLINKRKTWKHVA